MKKHLARAAIEVGFIVFIFYSNLLMGEYGRSGLGPTRGLAWALADIFTATNLLIAILAGFVGYLVVEVLRSQFL
jgi:hypothetical protein